jgi:hypothetical protein
MIVSYFSTFGYIWISRVTEATWRGKTSRIPLLWVFAEIAPIFLNCGSFPILGGPRAAARSMRHARMRWDLVSAASAYCVIININDNQLTEQEPVTHDGRFDE